MINSISIFLFFLVNKIIILASLSRSWFKWKQHPNLLILEKLLWIALINAIFVSEILNQIIFLYYLSLN
jgi:hypothetical protein